MISIGTEARRSPNVVWRWLWNLSAVAVVAVALAIVMALTPRTAEASLIFDLEGDGYIDYWDNGGADAYIAGYIQFDCDNSADCPGGYYYEFVIGLGTVASPGPWLEVTDSASEPPLWIDWLADDPNSNLTFLDIMFVDDPLDTAHLWVFDNIFELSWEHREGVGLIADRRFFLSVEGEVTPRLEVPEPASLALFGIGLLGLGLARRCRTCFAPQAPGGRLRVLGLPRISSGGRHSAPLPRVYDPRS